MNIPYPNLYATPGHHEKADAFNRVQRGAQSVYESLSPMQCMALLGGLTYPVVSAAGFNVYLIGNFLYANGYADVKLDVKTARYKKGGWVKPLGMLACLGTSFASAGKLAGLF